MTAITADQTEVREAMDQHSLRSGIDCLGNFRARDDSLLHLEYWQMLRQLKKDAVIADDQLTAKAIWIMETIGRVQDDFVSAFLHIRQNEYKEGWDKLDRCGTELGFLKGHFTDVNDEFGIEHVKVHSQQLREFFPYTWGISPAYVKEEVRCSICDTKLTLRSKCNHKNGEIYNGEMATHVITKGKLLHISLVDNPVQKYSVIFPNGDDDPRLKPISELASRLKSPWRRWQFEIEERRDFHPAFRGVGRNDGCPCGSSLKYKRCCLSKEKVFPHYKISIAPE